MRQMIVAVMVIITGMMMAHPVGAVDFFDDACDGVTGDATCDEATDGTDARADAGVAIQDIVNVLLYIIGGLSVIMIVFGGFRYLTSAGDANAVQSAKNMILYAVIGLVVAMAAYAIVNFVIAELL